MSRAERRRAEKSSGSTSPDDASATSEGTAPEPSPLAPWIERLSLSLLVATVILRVFTSGGGIELLQPGVQILADSLGLCSAGCLVAARALGRQPVFRFSGWAPWVLLTWALWLAWGASDASHPDLAWRSALTFTTLPLLGLVAIELSGGRPERTALLFGVVLAAVAVGAALAGYQGFVEIPNLIADYQSKDPELMAEIALQDPSYQLALIERLHSRGATGPFLLPGLLASACAAALPLVGLATGRRLARQNLAHALPAAIAVLVLALGLVLSRSKGAVVSATLVVGAALLLAPGLRRYRRRLLVVAGLGVAALTSVGLLALWLGPERAGVGLSLSVRLEYWEAALAMWQEAPLRGLGINQFREYYSGFKAIQAEEALHAHNAPLQLLAETGLVGLGLFAGTLAVVVRRGLRVAWSDQRQSVEGALPWIDGAFAAGGLFAGWLLLGAHGDTYNAATTGAWLVIGAGVLLLGPVLWRALRGTSPRLVAGAALAGSSVLIGDGLLNFGVHHAGFSLVVWLLLGLAGGMVSKKDVEEEPTRGGGLLGTLVCALTLGVIGGVLPGALEAEGERAAARAHHQEAAAGREVEENLRLACEAFAAACEGAPHDSRTWLERGAALARLGDSLEDPAERRAHWDAGVAATRESIRLAPRNAGATFQLGRLLSGAKSSPEDLEAAQAAFDRTLELYPSHPEHLLEAGAIRVRRARLGTPGTLAAEAEALLLRAEEVSEKTRLKRIQLRPDQVKRIADLRAQLGGLKRD